MLTFLRGNLHAHIDGRAGRREGKRALFARALHERGVTTPVDFCLLAFFHGDLSACACRDGGRRSPACLPVDVALPVSAQRARGCFVLEAVVVTWPRVMTVKRLW